MLNGNNQPAATVTANSATFNGYKGNLEVLAYKIYKDRQDVRGRSSNGSGGVVYGRLHVKGKILQGQQEKTLALLSIDNSGEVIPLALSSVGLFNKHMDNNTSFQIILSLMQDSYPEGLGLKTIPVYSATGDGIPYVAGVVTPDGVYSYFQYNNTGRIQTIVRMNDVVGMQCIQAIEGDVNHDCIVNFYDLAIMAANWLEDQSP